MKKDLMTTGHQLEEQLFHHGDDWFSSLFTEISNAKHCLLLEIHYMDDGKVGKELFRLLINALERGVTVKLIVDGLTFNGLLKRYWSKILIRKGAQLAIFNPLSSVKGLLSINKRSHKKVVIIDGQSAWVGSYNMDTRQMSVAEGGESWKDCGLKLNGGIVKKITHGFYHAWSFCHNIEKKRLEPVFMSPTLRLNHHHKLRKHYLSNLINKINKAKDRVWIENPYFVPDHQLCFALIQAAKRGVDIKIILPRKSDLKLFPLINFFFYKHLVSKNIAIFEYIPHILHKKVFIVDQWMMLGSSNLNSRTQKHDWEIDVALEKAESKKELESEFIKDLSQSKLVDLEQKRMFFGVSRFLRPFFVGIKYFL
jgi:cardiolipin synthase